MDEQSNIVKHRNWRRHKKVPARRSILKMYTMIIISIIASGSCAFADTIEFDQSGDKTQSQLYVEHPISGKVGAFVYNCQSKNWGQTRVGLTYAPTAHVKVAFGAGIETGGSRVGGSVWAGKGKFSGIYLLESGASGTWDKLVLKYQTTEKFALGWTKKQYAGQGAYAEYKFSKSLTVKYSGFETPEVGLSIGF